MSLLLWRTGYTVEFEPSNFGQGRKKAMRMLKSMLQERRAKPRKQQGDFFDYVLEELTKEDTILTEAIALDLMFVLLFATFETTSLALTMAAKFLLDHPLVLKELTVGENNTFQQNMLFRSCLTLSS